MRTQAERKMIADTILQQLGGGKFIVMTGAKHFSAGESGVRFSLPSTRNFVKDKIRIVDIELTPADTYTIRFYQIEPFNKAASNAKTTNGNLYGVILVKECDDVYCDSLQDIFTSVTGLDTHL